MQEPVTFFNRETRQIETEAIYGENFLRWAYERPLGRLSLWLLVKRALFSQWYGWRMSRPESREMIAPFIAKYNIREDEMAEDWLTFGDFNAFFSRKLKPSSRPVVPDDAAVAFPADGRHFVIPDLVEADGIFVKGVRFDLKKLLQDDALVSRFEHGSALISRLCPVDYHRFHFPLAGVPDEPRLINGPLFSVNPIALRVRPTIFWENKRCITRLQTGLAAEVLLLEIGATCVGTVEQTFEPGVEAAKGDEKGFFLFGGSCVMTIFEPGSVEFSEDLLYHSSQRREVFAKMGDEAARIR